MSSPSGWHESRFSEEIGIEALEDLRRFSQGVGATQEFGSDFARIVDESEKWLDVRVLSSSKTLQRRKMRLTRDERAIQFFPDPDGSSLSSWIFIQEIVKYDPVPKLSAVVDGKEKMFENISISIDFLSGKTVVVFQTLYSFKNWFFLIMNLLEKSRNKIYRVPQDFLERRQVEIAWRTVDPDMKMAINAKQFITVAQQLNVKLETEQIKAAKKKECDGSTLSFAACVKIFHRINQPALLNDILLKYSKQTFQDLMTDEFEDFLRNEQKESLELGKAQELIHWANNQEYQYGFRGMNFERETQPLSMEGLLNYVFSHVDVPT